MIRRILALFLVSGFYHMICGTVHFHVPETTRICHVAPDATIPPLHSLSDAILCLYTFILYVHTRQLRSSKNKFTIYI